MKIKKIEEKSYYYGTEEYCCKRMKKYLGRDMIIWISNGKVYIGNSYKDNTNISHCPFCGEKIEYES